MKFCNLQDSGTYFLAGRAIGDCIGHVMPQFIAGFGAVDRHLDQVLNLTSLR
jgi:hypothetical protein